MAANFFDQFDPATAKPEGGGKGGNFFDQFDPGFAAPTRSLARSVGDSPTPQDSPASVQQVR